MNVSIPLAKACCLRKSKPRSTESAENGEQCCYFKVLSNKNNSLTRPRLALLQKQQQHQLRRPNLFISVLISFEVLNLYFEMRISLCMY